MMPDNKAYDAEVGVAGGKPTQSPGEKYRMSMDKDSLQVEDDSAKIGFRDLVIKYASKSTVHGLPSTVGYSLYSGQRCLWFLLVSIMAVALTTAMTIQLKNFYEWPTVVNIREKPMDVYEIPEVTFCAQEPITFQYQKDPWGDIEYPSFVMVLSTEFMKLSNDPECQNLDDQTGQCLLQKANDTETSRLAMVSYDRGGSDRVSADFYTRVVTNIGVCNTFKTSAYLDYLRDFKSVSSVQAPIDIVVSVKRNLLDFLLARRVGIQVTLHTKEEPPFPREKKIYLSVNTSCRLKYKKVIRRALTTPYKSFYGEQCVDTSSPEFVNPLTRYKVYNKDTCLAECLANFIIQQCNCRYYLDPGTEELCSFSQTKNCIERTRASFSSYKENCNCTPPCEDIQFESSLSCSQIVNPEYDLVHLELMSSSEMETEILQVPVYTAESVLGSLGGLIGLFMGFSLVSILEFVELMIITVASCVRKRRNDSGK